MKEMDLLRASALFSLSVRLTNEFFTQIFVKEMGFLRASALLILYYSTIVETGIRKDENVLIVSL